MVKPNVFFWPTYSHNDYLVDLNSTVWVTPEQLKTLTLKVGAEVKKSSKVIDIKSLTTNTEEAITKFQSEHKLAISKQKKFAKGKFKPTVAKKKATTVKKIYGKFDNENLGSQALARVLQVKYGLDEPTAKSWIIEFVKFLTLKMIETDDSVDTNSFPCSIVEETWRTFFELGVYYRTTFGILFPDSPLPFPESVFSSYHNYEEVAKRYGQTLEKYQEIFEEEPNPAVWETLEQRFPNSSAAGNEQTLKLLATTPTRVAVNAFRYAATLMVKYTNAGANPVENLVCNEAKEKGYFQQNTENTTKRNNARTAGSLHGWRVLFPNCNNVYTKVLREDPEQAYIYNPYSKNYKSALAFSNGGFLFFPNPFNPATLKLKSTPKTSGAAVLRSMDLDNLADNATEGIAYSPIEPTI